MICAEFVTDAAGQVTLRPTAVQPLDLSACQAVLATGADSGAISLFSYPSPDQAAAAWVLGFSLVIVSFVTAWGVGAVINLINRS